MTVSVPNGFKPTPGVSLALADGLTGLPAVEILSGSRSAIAGVIPLGRDVDDATTGVPPAVRQSELPAVGTPSSNPAPFRPSSPGPAAVGAAFVSVRPNAARARVVPPSAR